MGSPRDSEGIKGAASVHEIGSVLVECPKCGNQDLVICTKGFLRVRPGSPQGTLLDPNQVFICVKEGGEICHIFDIQDWYEFYKNKEAETAGTGDKNDSDGSEGGIQAKG